MLAERTAQAAAVSARANLAVREKELESARAILGGGADSVPYRCCFALTAPVSGRILRVLQEDEQVVQAGTPIFEIGDTTDMEIVADVLSRDAVEIVEGAEATITGWGGEALAAQVDRIEPAATTRVSALGIEERRVEVRLSLRDTPPEKLGHGFRVTARIMTWQGSDVLKVPIAAPFRVGPDWAVYAVEDGRAALRRITIGKRNEEHAEVLDGLAVGDIVILHPGDTVEPGRQVAW